MDEEIFIKKVKPEITECRILQIEDVENEREMQECEKEDKELI